MNTKRFSISIPEPCSENWEEMTPCERGRFCRSCQKTVIDFTTWNDAALADFFVWKENQNVCGRFYKHQIEDKLFSCTAPLKKHYRTLAMAASVAALTLVSATASAQTQKKTDVEKETSPAPVHVTQYDTSRSVQERRVLTDEEIRKMPVRNLASQASTLMGLPRTSRSEDLNISGAG